MILDNWRCLKGKRLILVDKMVSELYTIVNIIRKNVHYIITFKLLLKRFKGGKFNLGLNNIISERLILRIVKVEDAKDIWEIWSNSDNEKYMSDPVESLEEVISICENRENNEGNGYLTIATLKDTGKVIGTCTFGPTDNKHEWGFGYSINKEHWGRGYATEIVKTIIKYGHSIGITEFVGSHAIENTASGKVMEKAGMHKESKGSFKQPKLNVVYESQIYKLYLD